MQAHEYQGLTSADIGFIHGLRFGLEMAGASHDFIEKELRSWAAMFRRMNELEVERMWFSNVQVTQTEQTALSASQA